jgi:tRNA dimethylallyltransferase
VIAVVGPTATGKTDIALRLAQQLDGELISADSRQVYKECDIGTNKPNPDSLAGIKLHLIDLVAPGEDFTVADYQPLAYRAVSATTARGRLPIFQGGTGLYLRAVFQGWNLADAPPDKALRRKLEQRIEEEGTENLLRELERIDAAAARKTQGNPRRLIRALEIASVRGTSPSEARGARPPHWRACLLGLQLSLEEIDRRIADRVDRMLQAGWLAEVRRLREHYPDADLSRLGHGYPELAAHLEGTLSLDEARMSTIRQVRQYARRQLTWFRAEPEVRWIPPEIEAALVQVRACFSVG